MRSKSCKILPYEDKTTFYIALGRSPCQRASSFC